jgi:hypothetical protein
VSAELHGDSRPAGSAESASDQAQPGEELAGAMSHVPDPAAPTRGTRSPVVTRSEQ